MTSPTSALPGVPLSVVIANVLSTKMFGVRVIVVVTVFDVLAGTCAQDHVATLVNEPPPSMFAWVTL